MDRLYLAKKKSDPGRPVIPIVIGPRIFQETICDFGASVNIMPKVIYDQINEDTLLHTNMRLQLADQSLCYPKGVLEDAIVWVGQSYVPIDFVVLETGGYVRAPIILVRPFLNTIKAIIYAIVPRSASQSRIKRKKFLSRTASCYLPNIHKRRTCPKRQ